MKFPALLFVFAVVGIASPQIAILPTPSNTIKWRTFTSGSISKATKQELVVIDSENTFQRYWVRYMGQDAAQAPKGLDWNTEKLIAFHLGTRNTGGFQTWVQRIDRGRDGIARMTINERKPMRNQIVTQHVTSPWTIIRVDRSSAEFQYSLEEAKGFPPGITIIDPGRGRDHDRDRGDDKKGKCNCTNCSCGCGCGG